MTSTHTVLQRIDVSWDFPVVFTHALFDPANPVLVSALHRKSEDRRHRAMVFIDNQVAEALPALADQVTAYFAARPAQLEFSSISWRATTSGFKSTSSSAIFSKLERIFLREVSPWIG